MDCCCNFGTFWAENRGGQCDPCPQANSNEREKLCQSLHGPESQTRDVCSSSTGNGNICPDGKCVPDKSKPGKIFQLIQHLLKTVQLKKLVLNLNAMTLIPVFFLSKAKINFFQQNLMKGKFQILMPHTDFATKEISSLKVSFRRLTGM